MITRAAICFQPWYNINIHMHNAVHYAPKDAVLTLKNAPSHPVDQRVIVPNQYYQRTAHLSYAYSGINTEASSAKQMS